jgi:hypothetical protein
MDRRDEQTGARRDGPRPSGQDALDDTDRAGHRPRVSMICSYVAWRNRNTHHARFDKIIERRKRA